MASTPQQEPAAGDLPRMPHVAPATDLPPTIESLSGFFWVNAVLHIPTGEFGSGWASETFGAEWQETMPFLKAAITRKIRFSKTNGQRWLVIVDYDKSEFKRDTQYLYDRIEDRDYLKKFLQPELPVAPVTVATPSNDTATLAVKGTPGSTTQPRRY